MRRLWQCVHPEIQQAFVFAAIVGGVGLTCAALVEWGFPAAPCAYVLGLVCGGAIVRMTGCADTRARKSRTNG